MNLKTLVVLAILIICIETSFAQEAEIIKLKWNWIICNVLCVILFIAGALATVIIAFSGLKYISSESPEEVSEAKSRAIYAIIALIFVFLTAPFVNYLTESFTPPLENFTCWCTNIIDGGNYTDGNGTCSLVVKIIAPGPSSEFENDTPIQFAGYGWGGTEAYTFEWSSEPPAISRTITQSYSQDSFYESLTRGEYTIDLKVTDSEGCVGTDSVKIKVIIPKPPT